MCNSDFDEVDLNYIFVAVANFKMKIKSMDPVWFGGHDAIAEYEKALSNIEKKICTLLDGERLK